MVLREKWPVLGRHEQAAVWLQIWTDLGRAPRTIDAYARGLAEYLLMCEREDVDPVTANRAHISVYVRELTSRPHHRGANVVVIDSGSGLANATIQQRLVPVRLFYDFLMEEGLRESNPVGRGRYTPGRWAGGQQRGLVPRLVKLPWIPGEQQWLRLLEEFRREPVRNRVMLALAHDAALRREELCSLRTDDVDPAHRTLRIRAETTKNRLERVVPYSAPTGVLMSRYLIHRALVSRARGPLFLSESRRNHAQPLSLWTWSKVVRRIALASGVERFSTHTTRHLCLTDLARMGWEVHAIAAFAGHRHADSTLRYIHLSGRELADKLNLGYAAHPRLARSGPDQRRGHGDVPVTVTVPSAAGRLGSSGSWQWPVDPARYDTAPLLRPAEQDAIAELGPGSLRRLARHDRAARGWQQIRRLLCPLDDAAAALEGPLTSHRRWAMLDATAVALLRCAETGRSCWAWTDEEWAGLLGQDQCGFRKAAPGWADDAVRPYLAAHAFLLGGFTAFYQLGGFSRLTLAWRVFGARPGRQ